MKIIRILIIFYGNFVIGQTDINSYNDEVKLALFLHNDENSIIDESTILGSRLIAHNPEK